MKAADVAAKIEANKPKTKEEFLSKEFKLKYDDDFPEGIKNYTYSTKISKSGNVTTKTVEVTFNFAKGKSKK